MMKRSRMKPPTLALASVLLASCGGDAGTRVGDKEAVGKAPEGEKPEDRTPEVKTPEAEPPVVKAPTPDGLKPVPLPEWVGFPAAPGELQAAIDARDPAPLRQHAWRLFAGINQRISAEDPRPLWWTWSTTTQLFEQPAGPPTLTAMTGHRHMARALAAAAVARPPAPGTPDPDRDHTDECVDANNNGVIFYAGPTYVLPMATVKRFGLDPRCADPTYFLANTDACALKDGTHFQSNGDILVATESYSEPGADRIETLRYNEAATLQGLLAAGTKVLPRLATQQVTTKHMYWPVKARGRSALPVFREPPRDRWCQYNGYEGWADLIAVEPGGAGGKGAVDFLFGVYDSAGKKVLPTRHATVDVHPLDEFYAQQIDQARWDALDVKDQMMLDAASQWAHGKPFEPGDHVVTVAMHIITREIPQWTLQSAWWSDLPDAGPYAADRPELPRAQGPWRHYLMTVEDGITREPGGAALPVAFNPFIELAATHPVATNCRNCHIRASWPTSSYLTGTGPGPLANIGVDDEIFAGLLLTDFQWVIADRVKASK